MSSKRTSVFFQQSSGPSSNSFENPRRTGFMTKHGGQGFKANWKKRYFVLDSGYLFYYASENEKKPLGIVCLADYSACRRVSSDDPKNIAKKSPNMIVLKALGTSDPSANTRDYFMFTDTEEEVSLWVTAVSEEITTAQHDEAFLSKSGFHHKDATDGNVSKGKKMTKDEQKSFDEVTKRASESSALQHITASRPRPVGRRKPRKYITYDEDDETGITASCAPRISQYEPEMPSSVPEKRTQSSPGRHRALLPKAPPLVPPGGGVKAQRPAESSSAAALSNGPPPPLPSGKKPSAEGATDAQKSSGPPPPLPSNKPKLVTEPTEEMDVGSADDMPTAANESPPVPKKVKHAVVGPEDGDSVVSPRKGPPPPLPAKEKPSKPQPTTPPETRANEAANVSELSPSTPTKKQPPVVLTAVEPVGGGPSPKLAPVPEKVKHAVVGPEDGDSVVSPRKGPPPPLPAKEKPNKPQPTTPPETRANEAANVSELSPSTPTKKQPPVVLTAVEPVGGGPSPKLAPKPNTSTYKSRLSPSTAPKRQSEEQTPSLSPMSKRKADQPLPKPRHRVYTAEDNSLLPQQEQATLAKPVPKPRTRSSSGSRSDDVSPRPTSPAGKPEEDTSKATSAETVEDNKPTTPTVATPLQLADEAEKDKPPTPTSPSTPAAMADKTQSSTPASTTALAPTSPAEAIEMNPSAVQPAVKGPIIDTPEPTPQAEVPKDAEQDGTSDSKKDNGPQKQPPMDEEVSKAPPTITTAAPPTPQESATSEGLEVQASHPPLQEAEQGERLKEPNASRDNEVYELAENARNPSSVIGVVDATGKKAEQIPQSPVSQLPPPTNATTDATAAQPSEPKVEASEQYEPFEMSSSSNIATTPSTSQPSSSVEAGDERYEPLELPSEQEKAQRSSVSVEICESAYGLVDVSGNNESKGEGDEDDETYANEGSEQGQDDSDDSDDVYEAMVVPEDDLMGIGYVKMKPGTPAPVNILSTPPRRVRPDQGYDNARLRSSPYTGRDVKGSVMALPRDRESSHSRSGHSSTSTEYEMVVGATKGEIEGLINEFDFYPDTTSLNLEQAKEVLRLARIARTEAEEMRRKARQELELAERERKDAELIKRNALEILRMAKEKL